MNKKKVIRFLSSSFGEKPDVEYFDEDMNAIRAYHTYRKEQGMDDFAIDDITWNDLSMDAVFKRLNPGLSTPGEQMLYHHLRCPSQTEAEYEQRRGLIEAMEQNPALRLKLQMILYKLGKRRAGSTQQTFHPTAKGDKLFPVTVLLVTTLVALLISLFFTTSTAPFAVLMLFICLPYHFWATKRLELGLPTANYAVGMVFAFRRMERLNDPALNAYLAPYFEAARRARPILRAGGVSFVSTGDIAEIFNLVFQLDLFSYELLRKHLRKHRDDVFAIHEALGRIDTAIAVASYRKSAVHHCAPELSFDTRTRPSLYAEEMVHPLLSNPIPNTADISENLLLTGSNASGKSTFLKAVAINALFAQSLCTALCKAYRASVFRIYSSMAIADDVLSGDSYFIAEIKSLKRILDAVDQGERVLCVVDEVLRGTNTLERIAASSEALAALDKENALCLAATHDIELCALLGELYRLAHFEESIENGGIHFDYTLREGPATTRNAIRLLELMGFAKETVAAANAKVEAYLKYGAWCTPLD